MNFHLEVQHGLLQVVHLRLYLSSVLFRMIQLFDEIPDFGLCQCDSLLSQ